MLVPSKHIRLPAKWAPVASPGDSIFPLFVFLFENYKSKTIYHSPQVVPLPRAAGGGGGR